MSTAFPHRVRLHGGRNTHAFGPKPGMPEGITACGYPIGTSEERKPDDAVITCRNCIREVIATTPVPSSSHMCVGPSCWTCGEPSELQDLRHNTVMPALYDLLQQYPTADHHRLAAEAMRVLRPTLMRWLHAENLLRDVLNHADGTWSPPGGLDAIAVQIRQHLETPR